MSKIEVNVKTFRDVTLEHYKATKSGDYKTANAMVDKMTKAFEVLRNEDTAGREALLELIHDPIDIVAINAACYSLKFAPKECIKVLRIKGMKFWTFESFNARQTLRNWKNGSWALE